MKIPRWFPWALVAVVVLMNLNILDNEFLVWDDSLYVVRNPRVHISSLADLRTVWDPSDALEGRYIEFFPLRDTLYALVYWQFGLAVLPYHLVQLGLYAALCVLVWQFARGLLSDVGAALTACWFAVHPTHVESVAWMAALKDPLCGCLLMGSLLSYRAYRRSGLAWGYAGALLALVGALLVKSFGILIPPLLVLVDWMERRPLSLRAVVEKVPFAGIAAGALYFFVQIGHSNGIMAEGPPGGTAFTAFLTMTMVAVRYWGILVAPVGLSARYVIDPVLSLGDLRFWGSVAVLAAVWGLAWWARSRSRVGLFALVWMSLCFLPVMELIPIPGEMADRYAFLPSIGAAVAVGGLGEWLFARGEAWGRRVAAGAVALSVVGVWLTVARNDVWQNDEALWKDVLEKAPQFDIGHDNLGQYYLINGRFDEARVELLAALRLNADRASTQVDLGTLDSRTGHLEDAEREFKRAAELDPKDARAPANVGVLAMNRGDLEGARPWFERSLAIDPRYPAAHRNLGMVCTALGDFDCGVSQLEEAVRGAPHDREIFADMLRVDARAGRPDRAAAWRDHLAQWFPDDDALWAEWSAVSGQPTGR